MSVVVWVAILIRKSLHVGVMGSGTGLARSGSFAVALASLRLLLHPQNFRGPKASRSVAIYARSPFASLHSANVRVDGRHYAKAPITTGKRAIRAEVCLLRKSYSSLCVVAVSIRLLAGGRMSIFWIAAWAPSPCGCRERASKAHNEGRAKNEPTRSAVVAL